MASQCFKDDSEALESRIQYEPLRSDGSSKDSVVYLDGSLEQSSCGDCANSSEFLLASSSQIILQQSSDGARRVPHTSEDFIPPSRSPLELAAEVEHLKRQLDAAHAREDRLTREKTDLITTHQREMDGLKLKFSEIKVKQDIDISLLDLEKTFLTRKVHKAEAKLAQSKGDVDNLKQLTQALRKTIDKHRSDSAAEIRHLKERMDNDKKNILAEHQKTKAALQTFQSMTSLLERHVQATYAVNQGLEADIMRFKRESEEAKAKLEEYETTVETLRMHFGEMEASMLAAKVESGRMRAEIEGYCEGTTELEAVNARLASDLESTEKRILLVTMNNELLLQTVSDLRSPNPHFEALQAESVRLAQENLQLQERLLEYEEQEVEGAVFDYEEDQSFDQPPLVLQERTFIAGEALEHAIPSLSASENDEDSDFDCCQVHEYQKARLRSRYTKDGSAEATAERE
ncbi:uncharacterized protein EV420DRAFT_1505782 [Desarmillaria tabescens]|uniref:Uncharacterized protein n=1 Tax=Armillaria tabescens TaxID=1929756 RepID=A0AA39NJX1_ARMTA|nr:uncharacterized protein EV420DRAFT_1505782 [Desarmillaria tabescens]KAK0466853.1 hypothetical protein EV420DRAFT_1505782 [Desarmillaria tabescens]